MRTPEEAVAVLRLHARTFAAFGEPVWVTRLDGWIVAANPVAEATAQQTSAELAAVDPASDPRWTKNARDILAAAHEGRMWSADHVVTTPHGVVTFEMQSFGLHADDGELVGFATIGRDVTKARRDSTAVKESEARWRAALATAPMGIALTDLDGGYVMVNQAMCRLVGLPEATLLEMNFRDLNPPGDPPTDEARLGGLLTGELADYVVEKRYLHADGHAVWVRVSVGLVRHPETGEPENFVATVEDVTARRRSQDRLASIIASATDAFVGCDTVGNTTEWNAEAERLLGWSRDEAIGRPVGELIVPPAFRDQHTAGLHRLAEGGRPRILGSPTELTAVTRDGREVPVEVTVWRAGGDSGEFYSFVRDITERHVAARRREAISEAQLALSHVELSPTAVMREICHHAMRLTGGDSAAVQLIEGDELVHAAVLGEMPAPLGLRVRIDASLTGFAVTDGRSLICADTDTDPRVDPVTTKRSKVRSVVIVPLRRGQEVFGTLLATSTRPHVFGPEDQLALELLSTPFAAALGNAWQLEKTSHLAMTDPVTGLPNRSSALKELERALLRQSRRGGLVAAVFIDLDRFKEVNDTLGHEAGDALLVAVAQRLRDAVRGSDIPARYGGDEFLVLCESIVSRGDVVTLGDRLVRRLPGRYPVAGTEAEIGASIGIAVCAAPVPVEDLLRAADQAMYEAKKAGGSRHVIRYLG